LFRIQNSVIRAGAVALGALAAASCGAHSATDKGDAKAEAVGMARVETRDAPIYLTGSGVVQALQSVTVRPQIDGQVTALGFNEGDRVRKGMVLASLDDRALRAQLAQAEAAQARDAAQLAMARLNLSRSRILLAQDSTPRQTAETDAALVDQDAAIVKSDQAQADFARVQLDYARIRSPLDGVTGLRRVDVGASLHATDATGVVVVSQVQPIAVVISLPGQMLAQVATGPRVAPLSVQAYDRNPARLLASGRLAALDNQIDPTTATVKLKAVFENRDARLWPGQFVDARILVGVERAALVVPTPAIQQGPDGPFVYVVAADRHVRLQPVEPGEAVDGSTIVKSGLRTGEQVVTAGQYKLEPGALVKEAAKADGRGAAP
jgi:multidrug efflux system membrane fusion protein